MVEDKIYCFKFDDLLEFKKQEIQTYYFYSKELLFIMIHVQFHIQEKKVLQ